MRLKKLINEDWHTKLTLTTDCEGYVTFRGFYGNYGAVLNGQKVCFGIHKEK